MRSKRTITVYAILALLLFVFVPLARAADPVSQVLVNYADILKANPMPAGEKAQAIKVAGDDTATLFVARFAPGADVKAHFHKSHTETLYVIEGKIEMMIDGKALEFKPGAIIFIPMNKVHAAKITSSSDLVALQVLTPALKEADRVSAP